MLSNYASVYVLCILAYFYVLSILFQLYMHVLVHGASFSEVYDGLVASSSPVGGPGTLQCGIRAKVAA